MRVLAAAALFLAGACSGVPEKPKTPSQVKAEREASEVFERWREVTAAGDVDAHYELLTVAFVSQWLFDLSLKSDRDVQVWRESLAHGTPARTDLDLWWEFCKKKYKGAERPDPLPYRVYLEPSLRELYRKIFKQEGEPVKIWIQSLSVSTVAADPTGVTITVKTDRGVTQGFAMAYERGSWRIDGFRENRFSYSR